MSIRLPVRVTTGVYGGHEFRIVHGGRKPKEAGRVCPSAPVDLRMGWRAGDPDESRADRCAEAKTQILFLVADDRALPRASCIGRSARPFSSDGLTMAAD